MLSLPISAKLQCAIWDNTTHADTSGPYSKCPALKYTTRWMWFGTRLKCLPAGRHGAVDGRSFGLWDGIEWIAVAMANHHLD